MALSQANAPTDDEAKTEVTPLMKRKSAQVLALLNRCVLRAHQKQFSRRYCKVPALLGIVLCTAGLLAVPERISAQVAQSVFAVVEVVRQDLSYEPESPTRRS